MQIFPRRLFYKREKDMHSNRQSAFIDDVRDFRLSKSGTIYVKEGVNYA